MPSPSVSDCRIQDQHEYNAPLAHRIAPRGRCFLEGYYEVFFGSSAVGKVQVIRQGLYYRFICRCKLPGDGIYRLCVLCGTCQTNLGVVVPEGTGFGLDKVIPVKKLAKGDPEFFLAPRHEPVSGLFVPISPEEPFYYIARLKDAFLENRNEIMGVVIRQKE